MSTEVRCVNSNTFDCFIGKQWSTWVRVRKGRSSVYRIAGAHIGHAELRDINQIIQVGMPITYGTPQEVILKNCQIYNAFQANS